MYDNIKIDFNLEGIRDFISTFNTDRTISKEEILNMLNKPAYSEFVSLFGCNFVSTKSEDWADIFYEAYKLAIDNKEFEGDDVVKRNIVLSVIWAINNVEQLEKYTNKVSEILSSKDFLIKAINYLPDLSVKGIDITLKYYIFMYNACVQGGRVLVDVPFCLMLGNEGVNDLLAHEMHHYLQNYLDISEGQPKEEYLSVIWPLEKLVSEGIADMCNFKNLIFIYEGFGWMKKGSLNEILNNVEKYINDLANLLYDRIVNKNTNVNINNFIYNNNAIHPIGYTMACDIENTLGINELRQCVGKPIRFIEKFNEAFEIKTNRKIFSERLIENLYKMYI